MIDSDLILSYKQTKLIHEDAYLILIWLNQVNTNKT